jgi:hypothetical protein
MEEETKTKIGIGFAFLGLILFAYCMFGAGQEYKAKDRCMNISATHLCESKGYYLSSVDADYSGYTCIGKDYSLHMFSVPDGMKKVCKVWS